MITWEKYFYTFVKGLMSLIHKGLLIIIQNYMLFVRQYDKNLQGLPHLIYITISIRQYCYYCYHPHFIDEEPEAQRNNQIANGKAKIWTETIRLQTGFFSFLSLLFLKFIYIYIYYFGITNTQLHEQHCDYQLPPLLPVPTTRLGS